MHRRPRLCLLLTLYALSARAAVVMPFANGDFEQGTQQWSIDDRGKFTRIEAAPGGGQAMHVVDADAKGGSGAFSARLAVSKPG
ncbi:MAG: hypothetical protein M5U09_03655, partial [Gammaproteobacteria bacterium]|nr:hypothetical protein [Gammaproteobacteria bacterium]